ncbi:MAG TPA: alkaline phosphatase family protein [Candidatus Sulfotelmatobacter sp.]|nr:alkaline phosphatase family protein [Candidatus Sulfotelmatobacter sp.]
MTFGKKRECAAATVIGFTLLICACQGLKQGPGAPPIPLDPGVTAINHVIVMAQENRSFDHYFGQLPAYWAANGYPSQQFDGLPPHSSNPGWNNGPSISAFHLATECVENLSPSWDESHLDWNLQHPESSTATMDGFVWNAAKFANDENQAGAVPPYSDTAGARAMGYYDGSDLNYYYFMASNFATSDRWFAPVMDRTQVNRLYLFAATSQGYAYPPGTSAADNASLQALTIFDSLTSAGISWKIYYSDDTCTSTPDGSDTSPSSGPCTYLTQFRNYGPPNQLPSNVVPISQYLTDVQAGTLPAVAFIEGKYISNLDEHPNPAGNIQAGAAYVASLINALMGSPSWKDSVFILTYDEAGGFYDHVPPQPAENPDGISPIDLLPGDVCASGKGANCNFDSTGYRVPLLVISPFTKKNYVSHTVADYTAILKLIEARFQVPSLTKRDAAQMDMTEFFDFQNVPWATPPSPPAQATNGACNAQVLR